MLLNPSGIKRSDVKTRYLVVDLTTPGMLSHWMSPALQRRYLVFTGDSTAKQVNYPS
ncbi:hypothetical protein [Mycobacterium leprae]|uniref:hypothetical protein n=1 Tax=Mycobacterium leprae TaxID=1769 RepID=UPI0002F61432|nr:hypothetical protein [Mycobacterium leprae]